MLLEGDAGAPGDGAENVPSDIEALVETSVDPNAPRLEEPPTAPPSDPPIPPRRRADPPTRPPVEVGTRGTGGNGGGGSVFWWVGTALIALGLIAGIVAAIQDARAEGD